MAGKYTATGEEPTLSSSLQTALGLIASTAVRGRLFEVMFSYGGTPADNAIRTVLQRFTVSAGTGVTENAVDPAEPGNQLSAKEAWDTGGTFTANAEILDFDLNQRATFRWVAAGPEWAFVIPATSDNGLGARGSHALYTGAMKAVMAWDE